MPETLAAVLIRRKADKLRKETGDLTLRTQAELDHIPLWTVLKIALTRPCMSPFLRLMHVKVFSDTGSAHSCLDLHGTNRAFHVYLYATFYFLRRPTIHIIPPPSDLSFVYSLLYLFFFAFPISFVRVC